MSVTTTLKKISASTTGRRSAAYHAANQEMNPIPEKRTITVSVVGLSGTEKEKGCMGSGKSCLCNRFVRPGEDDYHTDHISVLSQTDFGGRVVNNDHFLYWGHVTKGTSADIFSEYNQELGMGTMAGPGVMSGGLPPFPQGLGDRVQTTFHIVEQTEFIDDSSFQPFKSGKTDPYVKRCASLRLTSAEKLMYICKNQLGIEKEYEQTLMPDGRLNVDGFICIFDVSDVPGRSIERVVEYTAACLGQLLKTKKPVVVVATKCDEVDDSMLRELDRLLSRKEFKSANIPLVETSSHNGVNVDTAFMLLAHLIDKNRPAKMKILTYQEALKCRQDLCDFATDAYSALIRGQVNDYRSLWITALKRIQNCSEYKRYVELYGKDKAKKTFIQHTKRLKEQFIDSKIQAYLRVLPDILLDLLPDLEAIKHTDWSLVKEQLRNHPDFDQYFIDRPDESWEELVLGDDQNEDGLCDEDRVPFQLLDTEDAEQCYLQHRKSLENEDKRNDQRKAFKKLLEETGFVTPGKALSEVRVLFMGRECYEDLDERDIQDAYDEFQVEVTEKAKKQFQELLLERAELFYDFSNNGPGSVITQEDIQRITECLQEDIRYKTLERLDQDRKLILLRHLGFVNGPVQATCPASPDGHCMDQLVGRALQKAPRPQSWARSSTWMLSHTENGEQQLNVVFLAAKPLLQNFSHFFKNQCCTSKDPASGRSILELEKERFALELRLIDGDVSLPENSFKTADFIPHGCICLYEDLSSLEYIRESLEKTLLSNLEQDDRQPFHGLPIVMVLLCREGEEESELEHLRDEGNNRAKALQCPFIAVNYVDDGFDRSSVLLSISSLIEGIQRRAGLMQQLYRGMPPGEHTTPDVKVLLCMLCGDKYDVEQILSPLFSHQCCLVSNVPNTMTLEAYIGPSGPRGKSTIVVQVQVTSYHEAQHYRDELLHGFILAYSLERRASLVTMAAFSKNISHVPIQIVALANRPANSVDEENAREILLTEGEDVAHALQAHFLYATSSENSLSTTAYSPFFKDVYHSKGSTERAFSPLCDESCVSEYTDEDEEDDGPEIPVSSGDPSNMATLPLRGFVPQPPMRHESYNQISATGNEETAEGLYEQLPGESGLSPGSDDGNMPDGVYSPLYANGRDPDELKKLHHPHISDSDAGNNSLERRSRPSAGEAPSYPPPLPPARNLMSTFTSRGGSVHAPQENAYLISYQHPPMQQFRNGQNPVRNLLLKKSASLRAAPPPVVVPTRHSIDAGKGLTEESPEDDTVSSGLSAYGGYPPPDPAPPDLLPPASGFRSKGWVDNRLYEQQRGGTSTFGHGSQTPDDSWERQQIQQLDHAGTSELFQRYGMFNQQSANTVGQNDKPRPKPVGRINMREFDNIQNAIQRINVGGGHPPKYPMGALPKVHPASGAEDALHHYAPLIPPSKKSHHHRIKDKGGEQMSESDSAEMSDSGDNLENEHHQQQQDGSSRHRKSSKSRSKKKAIAVAPPKIPALEGGLSAFLNNPIGGPMSPQDPDKAKTRLDGLSCMSGVMDDSGTPFDLNSDLKHNSGEKRRGKEKKEKRSKSKKGSKKQIEDFAQSPDNYVPLFIEKCINFIEQEGLDSEGLYRVPGNRAHVDLLMIHFDENPNCRIGDLDIPVNAVATALKDFFSKHLPPLLSTQTMNKLTEASAIQDRSRRLLEMRGLLRQLPQANFEILKFVFRHFVKVAENCRFNNMDSKNLAICWWPTLLPLEFNDMLMFERVRPHLEDSVQTLIDQYRFAFCNEEEIVMV